MASRTQELVNECKRQHESCLYTSTALYEYLKAIRCWRKVLAVVPLVFGALASWSVLTEAIFIGAKTLTGVFAFVAGVIPTIYVALKLDEAESVVASGAAEFKNLGDRFRQTALVKRSPIADFESAFEETMKKMEEARCKNLTVPERFFRRAQAKVNAGDYSFQVDLSKDDDL
jgi:hypothetical protein